MNFTGLKLHKAPLNQLRSMGNVIYGNVSCFETLESCQQSCTGWQCMYVDHCNGSSSSKYVCTPIDSRFLTWIMLGSFLIVLICCSSLVACYVCRLLRIGIRYPIRTNSEIVFQNRSPIRTYAYA